MLGSAGVVGFGVGARRARGAEPGARGCLVLCGSSVAWGCGAGNPIAKMQLQQNVVMPLK